LSENTLLNFIRQQIAVENEIVDSLNEALKSISNPSVRGVLKGISLDSLTNRQRSLVEKHIRMEAELIKKVSDILPTVENEKVGLLLNAILADEKRHHQLLKEVLEIIVKGETITEEDWWDILWKNVPFHGAPGG
jgi:rubrerythrin